MAISRKPDPRFMRHGVQPRGKYLDRTQYKLCMTDHVFKEALRLRVSNTGRWLAFTQGLPYFIGRVCRRCQSQRRRVYNGACYDCMLNRNRHDFALIRVGVTPPANQSRDGWLDTKERSKRERSGECLRYESGPYVAEQFPTGRVRLIAPHLHLDMPDLKAMSSERVYHMGLTDLDFRRLLELIGWA